MMTNRCPVCHAPVGEPCRQLVMLGGLLGWVDRDEPHTVRTPR